MLTTVVNAWKYRLARRVYTQAIADHQRLLREYALLDRDARKDIRPALLILAELTESHTAMLRARRVMFALQVRAEINHRAMIARTAA